jgi:hypothetical protein
MPANTAFPHLHLAFEGSFDASFNGGRKLSPEVKAAQADKKSHSGKIRGQFDLMKREALSNAEERRAKGLPEIQGKGFLLRVPEGTDVDALAYALGVELVAETESGLMFAATDTLDLEKLAKVLSLFENNSRGGGGAASVLDVFYQPDDARKLSELLKEDVYSAWPFDSNTIYTFDLGIQTATSSRTIKWTRLPRKMKGQSADHRAKQVKEIRDNDRFRADETWQKAADARLTELREIFLKPYAGSFIGDLQNDPFNESRSGIVYPDSVEVRVRMSGSGFRDLVQNFKHLFEVSFPPNIRFLPGSPEAKGLDGDLNILSPDINAPKVCVIDSGIQEEHRCIEPAIDKATSRCFLPEAEPDDVADYVFPRGHGTRVAGAVLYPREVPKEGDVQPVAWIQNARVLDANNDLPISLPPERYLTEVVAHFAGSGKGTKIFNHSITAHSPCGGHRMCAWAAKIDDLSHRHDLLFIQAAGNVEPPAIYNSLHDGTEHPAQLLEDHARVSSPAQSLHALTVGSVAHAVVDDEFWRSFARQQDFPSAFSRAGYSPLWDVVKPEVVEYGGDRLYTTQLTRSLKTSEATASELIASTLHGEPAISRDEVGTSFAAPKVAHIAAHLQNLFPDGSAQLYRALIVQSAQWPEWAANAEDKDKVLRLIGYGIPSLERATTNNPQRVTLITAESKEIQSKQYHLYQITIPDEIRNAALEARVRIDVTLAYTACPRRTRSRRTGYLETWLDWCSISQDEPLEHFKNRMQGNKTRSYPGLPWQIHQQPQHGEVEVSRNFGSVQKDWTVIEANQLPETFAIAVRAHVGWNHKEGAGLARYCLAISFEALDVELPIYTAIEAEIEAQAEIAFWGE